MRTHFAACCKNRCVFGGRRGGERKPVMVRRQKQRLTGSVLAVPVYFIPHSLSLSLFKCHFCCRNVAFLPERQFCQKTHVPLQEVAQGFFFLCVCVSSIWCGGVRCWCNAACVFRGGPSDLSQPLQQSPAKSNMRRARERCSLPSA